MRTFLIRMTVVPAVAVLLLGVWLVTGQGAARGASKPRTTSSASLAHSLSVTGHGQVQQAPDMASLTIGVEKRSTDAQDALSRAASATNAIVSAIEAQGVPTKNIQTGNLSLYHDDQRDQYIAGHELNVRVDDINKVGAVLDAAVGAGANSSWGVGFGLKDPSAAQANALKAAIANARARADAMAGALNVTITGVASATDGSYSSPPIAYGAGAARAPSAGTTVQPGQLTLTADVNVTYAISP
ncbi:MAG: SIMPL domain-containing protein [Chloroflexota bacterium]